jgi:isopenicillin-N epimerase
VPHAPASPLDRWALSPEIVHLNHGSFGGCPRAVIDAAEAWRARIAEAPMRFLVLDWQAELDRARDLLAAFLRAPAARLAFVPNVTTGVAIALASLPLGAGDEVLVTDHAYRGCANHLARHAQARGARVVRVPIALPFDPDAALAALSAALTPRTRVALLDHVTSPTGLIMPIDRMVRMLAARGVAIVVDGAHAAGQVALDVGALLDAGVSWYAGTAHKWLCGPLGASFVVASPAAPALHPVVTSHGASPEYGPPNRFHAELDWPGTIDPTPYLAVPTAIATIAELANGWAHTVARNHAVAVEMGARLAAALATRTIARDEDLGAMAALPIALPPNTTPLALQERLLADGWEVPIVDFKLGPLVRVSAHLYNHADQADALAGKLRALGVTGRAV